MFLLHAVCVLALMSAMICCLILVTCYDAHLAHGNIEGEFALATSLKCLHTPLQNADASTFWYRCSTQAIMKFTHRGAGIVTFPHAPNSKLSCWSEFATTAASKACGVCTMPLTLGATCFQGTSRNVFMTCTMPPAPEHLAYQLRG